MLKTDYTNDILDTSKNTERVYNLKNASGEIVEENIRIEDITEYSQEGSKFGANDINAITTRVNQLTAEDGLDFKFVKNGNQYGYQKADGSFSPFKQPVTQTNLVAGNIKKGTNVTVKQGDETVYNVNGTYESTVTQTNLTASNIKKGTNVTVSRDGSAVINVMGTYQPSKITVVHTAYLKSASQEWKGYGDYTVTYTLQPNGTYAVSGTTDCQTGEVSGLFGHSQIISMTVTP